MIKKKRGQLALDEEKFIRDNYGSLSVDQIADRLNRNVDPINRYIKENNITYFSNDEEIKDNEILRQKLYSKTFWTEIKRQFDEI